MKKIEDVALIGLGALGILYASCLSKALGKDRVHIVADKERQARYAQEGIFINGEREEFSFISPDEKPERPCDLLIVSVKAGGLSQAILDARNIVGKDTVIISAVNGITSEQLLGEAFGKEKVLYCVSQGTDVVRENRAITYQHRGELVLGYPESEPEKAPALEAAMSCLKNAGISSRQSKDPIHAMYIKWMFNVGINQTVAYLAGTYGTVQEKGPAREMMEGAMREAKAVANAEGVAITDDDVNFYLKLADGLAPEGMPSMRQDTLAGRKTEVELFAGTVISKASKLGINVPINKTFYDFFTKEA